MKRMIPSGQELLLECFLSCPRSRIQAEVYDRRHIFGPYTGLDER
jgi:hypothetical protein